MTEFIAIVRTISRCRYREHARLMQRALDCPSVLHAMSVRNHSTAAATPLLSHNMAMQLNTATPTDRTPTSAASSSNTYLMPTSPSKKAKGTGDNYKPKIARTCGQRPACLVNASVTYCGNDQIYAFGGFDQYTDEGKHHLGFHFELLMTFCPSIQSRPQA